MLACRTDLILYKQVLFASEKKEYITLHAWTAPKPTSSPTLILKV